MASFPLAPPGIGPGQANVKHEGHDFPASWHLPLRFARFCLHERASSPSSVSRIRSGRWVRLRGSWVADGAKLAAACAAKGRENARFRPANGLSAGPAPSGTRFAQGYSGQTMWSKTENEMSRGQENEKEE